MPKVKGKVKGVVKTPKPSDQITYTVIIEVKTIYKMRNVTYKTIVDAIAEVSRDVCGSVEVKNAKP